MTTTERTLPEDLVVSAVDLCLTIADARSPDTVEPALLQLRDLLAPTAPLLSVRRRCQSAGDLFTEQDLMLIYGLANDLRRHEIATLLGLDNIQVIDRIKAIKRAVRAGTDAHLVAIAAGRGELWL